MAKGVLEADLGPVQHILHFAQNFKAVGMLPDLQDRFWMLQNRIASLAHDLELDMLANSDPEVNEHAGVGHRCKVGYGAAHENSSLLVTTTCSQPQPTRPYMQRDLPSVHSDVIHAAPAYLIPYCSLFLVIVLCWFHHTSYSSCAPPSVSLLLLLVSCVLLCSLILCSGCI